MKDSQASHTHSSIYVSGWLWEWVDQYNVRPESVSCVKPDPAVFNSGDSCGHTIEDSWALWSMQCWVYGVSSSQLWSKHRGYRIRECCSVLYLRVANKIWIYHVYVLAHEARVSDSNCHHCQGDFYTLLSIVRIFASFNFTLLKNLMPNQYSFLCSLKQSFLKEQPSPGQNCVPRIKW